MTIVVNALVVDKLSIIVVVNNSRKLTTVLKHPFMISYSSIVLYCIVFYCIVFWFCVAIRVVVLELGWNNLVQDLVVIDC